MICYLTQCSQPSHQKSRGCTSCTSSGSPSCLRNCWPSSTLQSVPCTSSTGLSVRTALKITSAELHTNQDQFQDQGMCRQEASLQTHHTQDTTCSNLWPLEGATGVRPKKPDRTTVCSHVIPLRNNQFRISISFQLRLCNNMKTMKNYTIAIISQTQIQTGCTWPLHTSYLARFECPLPASPLNDLNDPLLQLSLSYPNWTINTSNRLT